MADTAFLGDGSYVYYIVLYTHSTFKRSTEALNNITRAVHCFGYKNLFFCAQKTKTNQASKQKNGPASYSVLEQNFNFF